MLPHIEVTHVCAQLQGGSRSFRVLGTNGQHYILKLQGNPQGTFSLIAEYLGTKLMEALGLPVPMLAWAKITAKSVSDQFGSRLDSSLNQTHLAIAYPANPQTHTVLDQLPEPSWVLLRNRSCFWGALVADKWLANGDCRQAIFVRHRSINTDSVLNLPPTEKPSGLRAILIDQGLCFNGRSMDFKVAPAHGLYSSRLPYRGLEAVNQLEAWIDTAQLCTRQDLAALVEALPSDWMDSCSLSSIDRICSQLITRAPQLRKIMEQTIPLLAH